MSRFLLVIKHGRGLGGLDDRNGRPVCEDRMIVMGGKFNRSLYSLSHYI